MRLCLTAALVVLSLAGCQMLPGRTAPGIPVATGMQTSEITVETLDAPAQVAVPAPAARPAEPAQAAAAQQPKVQPAPVVRSPGYLACEKRGGAFVIVGKSGAFGCQTRTRDAGRSCRNSLDCEGSCLARSRSCAPIQPLFGCNDILQDDGRRVSLCID